MCVPRSSPIPLALGPLWVTPCACSCKGKLSVTPSAGRRVCVPWSPGFSVVHGVHPRFSGSPPRGSWPWFPSVLRRLRLIAARDALCICSFGCGRSPPSRHHSGTFERSIFRASFRVSTTGLFDPRLIRRYVSQENVQEAVRRAQDASVRSWRAAERAKRPRKAVTAMDAMERGRPR